MEQLYLDASYENIWDKQGHSASTNFKLEDFERSAVDSKSESQDIRNLKKEEKKSSEENLSVSRLSMISSRGSETQSHSESIRSRSESLNIEEDFFYDSEIDSDELEEINTKPNHRSNNTKLGSIIRKHLSVLDEHNRKDIDDYWSEIRRHVTEMD